jgi:hypothetical protein
MEINQEIIKTIHDRNGYFYNLHKASEECQELGLILNQKLLKQEKVADEAIIDEIGDVIIRLEILKLMFNNDKIQERIDYKLAKFEEYIDHNKYNKI